MKTGASAADLNMQCSLKTIFSYIFLFSAAAVWADAPAQRVISGVGVTIESDKPEYLPGEIILIRSCLYNNGTEPFFWETGTEGGDEGRSRLKVVVKDESGRLLPGTGGSLRFGSGDDPGGRKDLKPGETWCQSSPLARYVHIEGPGTYFVSVQDDYSVDAPGEKFIAPADVMLRIQNTPSEESSASTESFSKGTHCGAPKVPRKIDKVYREDGSVFSETDLFSDRYNGFYRTFHKTGEIDTELRYKDGQIIYNKAFDPDGNPLQREGLIKTSYANGNLYEEINYKNDMKNGLEKIYYYDGKTLIVEGKYWNNRRVGVHKIYDESGRFKEKVDWGYPQEYVWNLYKTVGFLGGICLILFFLIGKKSRI